MEFFFSENINKNLITLKSMEFRHCIKVMRHNTGDMISVIDGTGSVYKGEIKTINRDSCEILINDIIKDYYKKEYYVHIAISPIKNHDRLEWFVEKSIEIGVDEISFINRVFPTCRNISIDYGIMEKSKNVFVYPSDFGWSDLGTWGSLSTHVSSDKNDNTLISKQVLLYEAENNIVRIPNEKAAVIQGLDGYIIIDTKEALLICKKEEEQKIKRFVADVKFNLGDKFV